MATERMIEVAARGPFKPGVSATMHHEAEAVLLRPRAAQDVEEQERATAARMAVRMAFSRHSCPLLDACPQHGRELCDCSPCTSAQHADDVALAVEALQALGLTETAAITRMVCSTCHRSKPLSKFSKRTTTCKDCLSAKKAAREAS